MRVPQTTKPQTTKLKTTSTETANSTPKPGRPRSFCDQAALEAAMRVFWEKGYEGTSLTDLTEAMGINRPSLYAAFGDKEALFLKAIEQYTNGPASYLRQALAEPTAYRVIEALLRGSVKLLGDPHNPRGCLSVQGGLACGAAAEPVKQALVAWRKHGEAEMVKRFRRARAEGDLPAELDPHDLARYIATVLNGLSIQAANGATKAEMTRVVELTLRSLPTQNLSKTV
ncbi:MAG TPA: TetR/AcrR family transcriptional regulator [Granulicella sp.]|jgi:AcrR family transcriptional regulator|nr:TetR/AcrR family transcriptional regulator [Granulicella sp.]